MQGNKGSVVRSDPPEEPPVQNAAIGRSDPPEEAPVQKAAIGRSDPPEEAPGCKELTMEMPQMCGISGHSSNKGLLQGGN
jgi:hypothetical protein